MVDLADQLIPCSGRLQFEVFRGCDLVETFDEQNLIVVGSKTALSRLIGGAFTGKNITNIAFGTNGTAPGAGNTTLTGSYSKAVDTITYPASNQVRFAFSLGTTEANGMAILEFGLITADATLFARKTRSAALNKDSDLSLSGSWTLTF